jgi:osmotically-inducible protein OsmY
MATAAQSKTQTSGSTPQEESNMKDADIRRNVETELNWEPSVTNAAAIGVGVKDGVTTLSGYVDSYAERWAAERAAERVGGVTAVVNRLEVHVPDSFTRTDEEIAAAAVNALRWNLSVPDGRVKVEVNDGWLTLDGDVDWQYQRDAAETAVRYLSGVKGVSNIIGIKSPVSQAIVSADIEAALERSAAVDAQRIGVRVDGHTVTLTGTVRSYAERQEAERAAWASPDVYNVDDRIAIAV